MRAGKVTRVERWLAIQAGLFSVVTSAFVIHVHSQLQPDQIQETAALLRVLIHNLDRTAVGNDIPTVPEWTGPPPTIVQVEAILYASFATSLFSAFLAMLGKQWLNRYASIEMRGSTIKRSQDRQRKLNGIVTWYFDYVMESLPLMLQLALLLLGCALSLYLWGINTTIASVVIGITSFGVVFYAFIVIAGAASANCPYQTPGARILRHIHHHIHRHILPLIQTTLHSAFSSTINSSCISSFISLWGVIQNERWSVFYFLCPLLCILSLPFSLARDACLLVRTMIMGAITLVCGMRNRFCWVRSPRVDGLEQQVVASKDLQCISWILQMPLDKAIHISTLKSLAAMTALADFDPALVSACFDILAGCVAVVGREVVINRGSEELATLSDLCCLRAISHLAAMDPTSSVLKDVRQRYTETFPLEADFGSFPPCRSLAIILNISYPPQLKIQQKDYGLLGNEHIIPIQLSRLEYQKKRHGKVPRWFLRFVLHHLCQDPLPPTPVVIDCLSVVVIDMGCTVSDTTTLDERYVHIWQAFTSLIQKQHTTGGGFKPNNSGTRNHGQGC